MRHLTNSPTACLFQSVEQFASHYLGFLPHLYTWVDDRDAHPTRHLLTSMPVSSKVWSCLDWVHYSVILKTWYSEQLSVLLTSLDWSDTSTWHPCSRSLSTEHVVIVSTGVSLKTNHHRKICRTYGPERGQEVTWGPYVLQYMIRLLSIPAVCDWICFSS